MISSLTTTRKDDDDFSSSSSSFADNRRHHHRDDDARYDGREKKRTRASEGTRVFMNREKTTRLIERLDNMTKIQREGTPLNDDERLSRSDAI